MVWASENGYQEVVEHLLNHSQVDVNSVRSDGRTPRTALMAASYQGHTSIVKILVNHKQIEVNKKNNDKITALMFASFQGNSEVVKLLLNHSLIDVNLVDNTDSSALKKASFNNHPDTVKLLISHPLIDVNKADTTSGSTALYTASLKGYLEVVNQLLGHPKIDINQEEAGEGWTPLMAASKFGSSDIVRQLLSRNEIDVNKPSINRETPLMVATNGSYTSIVKRLLAFATVDVNFATFEGKTALRVATDSIEDTLQDIREDFFYATDVPLEVKTSILGIILRCPSTDINILDKEYKTPLDYANEKNTTEIINAFELRGINTIKNGQTCCSDKVNDGLQKAAEDGDYTMTKAFLQCHQVDLNQGYMYGMTPLFLASRKNHVNVVQLLLDDARTDVNKVVNSGNALWEATEIGNTNIVKLLIKHPQIDINQHNKRNKKTPLIISSERGHTDIVWLLLCHNQIDVNKKDSFGDSALQTASWRAHLGIVKLLLRCSETQVSDEYTKQLEEEGGKKEIIEAIDWWSTLSQMSATCCLNVKEDLIKAANYGDFRAIRGLLLCPESDINIVDSRGHTPLYLSAWKGHIKAVEVLLANSKIDVNRGATANGQTAFSIASQKGHFEIMQILIRDNRTNANVGWCESKWARYKQICKPINRVTTSTAPTTISKMGMDVNKCIYDLLPSNFTFRFSDLQHNTFLLH